MRTSQFSDRLARLIRRVMFGRIRNKGTPQRHGSYTTHRGFCSPSRWALTSSVAALLASVPGVSGDVCNSTGIRPVAFFSGFGGSPLYDASGNLLPLEDIINNPDAFALPLQWDEDGIQGRSDVGPDSGRGLLPFPTLDDAPPLVLQILSQSFSHLQNIVRTWERNDANPSTAPDGRLFFPVAWDWRRDLWEQAEVVLNATQFIKSSTGCRPILVGASLGGRLIYTAMARYGDRLAEHVLSVLYSAVPFQPVTSSAEGDVARILGVEVPPGQELVLPTVTFSWPSTFTTVLPVEGVSTGIACSSPLCGLSEQQPPDQPLFLPFNLTQAEEWKSLPIGLPRDRAQLGVQPLLNEDETRHLQFALNAASRAQAAVFDASVSNALRLAHPPAALMVYDLEEAQLLGGDAVPMRVPFFLECNASPDFNNSSVEEGRSQCESLEMVGAATSDGVVPAYAAVLPSAPDDTFRVFTYTEASLKFKLLAAVVGPTAITPHFVALQARRSLPNTFLNCVGFSSGVDAVPELNPSLEDLLCSIVARADPGGV